MKSKPFVLLFLLFLALPVPTYNLIFGANDASTGFQIAPFQTTVEDKQANPYTIIKAQNILHDQRWSESLRTHVVLSNLVEYDNRAMISFFTTEDRDFFARDAINHGINVERVFKSIPAIIISYIDSFLNQIDFNNFEIKYTYPIGTYEYVVPMNIDMEFPGLVNLAELREALQIDTIHDANHTGYGVIVAILDSGLNTSKVPALDGLLNYDEPKVILDITPVPGLEDQADFSGHGTHVATILAGNGKYRDENGDIIETEDYGIAPDARLINIKVLNQTGSGKDEWLIIGFDEAINQAPDLISASLTSVTFAETGDPIEELVYEAARNDIPIIASAGNYGPSGGSVGAPAIWDHVISVGASDGLNDLTIFTSKGLNQNFSAGVDVLAPGIAIQGSDAEDGGSRWVSGTSVSAPIVSGVMALLIGAFPGLSPHAYEAAVIGSADDLGHPIVYQGNGIINPVAAYDALSLYGPTGIFATLPRRISSENEYYYACVEGESFEFQVKLISSSDGMIILEHQQVPDEFLEYAQNIFIYEGWNHINVTFTIPMNTRMRNVQGHLGISGSGFTGINSFILFDIITRPLGGTVLFDISHENDTLNRWFDASTPYGTHMHLTRILKDRSFRIRTHTSGDYNFTDVNILVISDPELNFTSQEIDDIYNFVSTGGSLLFLIDSIRFIDVESIEGSPLISSNYYTCDEFLDRFNITVWETVPVNVPYEVYTTEEASMLTVDSFMFWGKMLHFTEDNDPNDTVLARTPEIIINDKIYIFDTALAKEVNNGRIMVFGSGYPFTDHGLLPDTLETNPQRVGLGSQYKGIFKLDANNLLLVNETFDWLIDTHRPQLYLENNPVDIMIRQSIDFAIEITLKNGTVYTQGGAVLNADLLMPDNLIEYIELEFNAVSNKYEFTYTFTQYGEYFLYVPLKLVDHTPTDGRIRIFNNVPFWDALPTIETAAIWISALIILTVIIIPRVRPQIRKTPPN